MVPNRLGEVTSLVPIRLGAETSKAESSRCRKTSVNRQSAVAVVVLKESCPSDYLAICWGANHSELRSTCKAGRFKAAKLALW